MFDNNDFSSDSDDDKFKDLLAKATCGNAAAQKNVANQYYNGKKVEKNYEKAVYWYTKAAEQGNAAAQTNLGMCYGSGEGVEKDLEKAIR
jgi:TPR repeat protein